MWFTSIKEIYDFLVGDINKIIYDNIQEAKFEEILISSIVDNGNYIFLQILYITILFPGIILLFLSIKYKAWKFKKNHPEEFI